MPSAQIIDLSPRPRTEETNLEKTIGGFATRHRENQIEKQETDALKDIYGQYQKDGKNLENAIMAIQTRPGLSPTTRVNSIKQLMEFQKHNGELQKKAQVDSEKAAKKAQEAVIAKDLQDKRGFTPEQASAYASNPALIDKVYPKSPKINQADRPIDEDQQNKINNVMKDPHWENATLPQKQQLLSRGDVSNANQKVILDSIAEHKKIEIESEKSNNKAVESAYKSQEKFINDTTSSYKAYETDTKPKLLQMQKLASDDEIINPTANAFLETLGIPLGALENPSSELYNKLSLDLLKGLPETYGNRILKVEVDNFLKTVPGLANSANGRRMIASNILKLGEMKEVYYNEMRKEQREYLDNNKPLPRDFQQKIFDQVKPQIDRINSDFVKLSEIKEIPTGTIPFFDPNGEIVFVPKEHAQWASENQGRKIW